MPNPTPNPTPTPTPTPTPNPTPNPNPNPTPNPYPNQEDQPLDLDKSIFKERKHESDARSFVGRGTSSK